jgi:hypothetical protein
MDKVKLFNTLKIHPVRVPKELSLPHVYCGENKIENEEEKRKERGRK